jgi:predicted nucleic acid-binding protein
MKDKVFVDTNILVYAHDRSTGRKHNRAKALVEEIWHAGNGVISTQVLQELCVSLRKKAQQPLPTDELRRLVQDYLSWEVVVNTADSTLQALDLELRFRISFWDALIVHAADTAGAAVLYSEDLSPGQNLGALRVVNPMVE